jgi:hypothetical protein
MNMNKINTFDEFLNEVSNTLVSGTSAGSTASLDRKKYELKKDVKGAKIGSYHNVLLPKGTIITNLPGGVFANHDDLKKKYCTGYGAERWDSSIGVMITQLPEVLVDIEKNSKVLESEDMIHFQTFDSFLNEGAVYATLKTVKIKLPNIPELSNMWDNGKKAAVNNLVKKVLETKAKIEDAYNKEQSTYDRPDKISDMNHDLTQLRYYIKDITDHLRNIKII